MAHNEYWKETWDKAHSRLNNLFTESKMSLDKVIGDEHGIDSAHDAKKTLAFVFEHRPSCEEKACAILSVVEALMAWHELNEHKHDKDEMISARAGVLVK